MKPLLAALGFLTLTPVPARYAGDEEALRRSVAWFPVVGALLGAAWAALGFLLSRFFPPAISAALLLAALPLASGCLHLDGLADTCDGFMSARPRERILEIMRDSRSGPMGVCAIVFVLIAEYAALAHLALDSHRLILALLLAPIAGRAAIVVCMSALRYARAEGMAGVFAPATPVRAIVAAMLLCAAAWFALRWLGAAAAIGVLAVTLLFCRQCQRKIGGYTGDSLGAACTLAEGAMLVLLCARHMAE